MLLRVLFQTANILLFTALYLLLFYIPGHFWGRGYSFLTWGILFTLIGGALLLKPKLFEYFRVFMGFKQSEEPISFWNRASFLIIAFFLYVQTALVFKKGTNEKLDIVDFRNGLLVSGVLFLFFTISYLTDLYKE